MAYSLVAGSWKRVPVGNKWLVTCKVDEVTAAGSYVPAATLRLSHIDSATGSIVEADAEGLAVAINSQTLSTTEDDSGDIWISTETGTHDVQLIVVGR